MVGQYPESMDYTEKSISMLKQLGNKEGIGYQYDRMGLIYAKSGHYDNALKYFNSLRPYI